MPPKKNKKPKLTKEQRKALKEQKKRMAYIKTNEAKMEREHKMTVSNLPKVVAKLYPEMKEETLSKMKQDLKVMDQIFKRVVDLKRHTIESLEEDIESAESAYMRTTRANTSHLDHLIDLMQERIQTLSEIYEKKKVNMLEEHRIHTEELLEALKTEEERWKVAIQIQSNEHKGREADAAGEYILIFENTIEKLQSSHDKMEGFYESELKKKWTSLKVFFHEFQQRTEERRKLYDKLLLLDEENSSCIKYQSQRIESMTNQIEKLKEQLKAAEEKYETEIGDLKAEREEWITLYHTMRRKVNTENKVNSTTRLKELVSNATDTENGLKKIVYKAEKILNMAQMCRALETLEEKIHLPSTVKHKEISGQDPQVTSMIIKEKIRSNLDLTGQIDTKDKEFLENIKHLECFWARVGRANMLRGELALRKEELMKENKMLKDNLREVLCKLGKKTYNAEEISKETTTCLPLHFCEDSKRKALLSTKKKMEK